MKNGTEEHVTRHPSPVTRHTSHVTRHTSHVTRHTLLAGGVTRDEVGHNVWVELPTRREGGEGGGIQGGPREEGERGWGGGDCLVTHAPMACARACRRSFASEAMPAKCDV